MLYVPVVSSEGKPLMPCHPARARELVCDGKAKRRFNKGIFYVQLTERKDGNIQPIAVGIDPGSKKEGYTVKSEKHTFLNIQADAITHVKAAIETRRNLRRARRWRNTPYRKCRWNRNIRRGMTPSIKARWNWKLRICKWLSKLFPIKYFVLEDIKAKLINGKCKWNTIFAPLQIGKHWFYTELIKISKVKKRYGWETKRYRDELNLVKTNNKLSDNFSAHCVDSWVLANKIVGGHTKPDNEKILFIVPIRFHRRQLHLQKPSKGGVRKPYGGTRSLGLKRGSLVKHSEYGLVYIGGASNGRITIHSVKSGKRITWYADKNDCIFLAYNSWRCR